MNYIANHTTQPPQILSESMARQLLGSDPTTLVPGESATNGDWTITRPASVGSVAPAAFHLLWSEAIQADSRQLYLAQWSVAGVISGSDLQLIQEYLGQLWDAAHMTAADLVAHSGLTRADFGLRYGIDYSTLTKWCLGQRPMPNHVHVMLARLLGLI